MRNVRLVASLVLILAYSGLSTLTWNRAVSFSVTGSSEWWMSVGREVIFWLAGALMVWEFSARKALPANFSNRNFPRNDSKLNFLVGTVVFVLIIAAIALVILPYRSRIERATHLETSQAGYSSGRHLT